MLRRRTVRSVFVLAAALMAVPLATTSHGQASATAVHRGATAGTGDRDLAPATPESAGVSGERLKRLDAYLKQLVDDRQVAGFTTVLARHGKVVHTYTVGKPDIGKPDALKSDAIFRIHSMTKPIIGVAMMMLHEEGKWRLEDPVSRHIPELTKLGVYVGKNADGSPKLEDARRSMTMRELMTHTGGLAYVLNANDPVHRMIIDGRVLDSGAPLQTMIDKLAKMPLLAQPGTRWSYSIGVDVQGYLIEKMSGMPLAEFLRTRIFGPLGMKDTGFYVPAEKLPRLAQVHTGSGATLAVESSRADPTSVPLGPSGGGGLYSTAADYARFCDMLLQGGQFRGARLLAPRTVEMMRTNHVNPGPLATMGPGLGWGMDFQVVTNAAAAGEAAPTGTFSWWGIAGSWFWIDPVNDLAFIGMVQHRDTRTTTRIHALSRSLVYQAVLE